MYSYAMPLYAMHALHFVAACDSCGARSAMICGHELPSARREAVARLTTLGWSQAALESERPETRGWVAAEGAGPWRCPLCTV
jgi:hypothetical protein